MKTFREFLDNRKDNILEAGKNPVDIKWSKSKNRWDGVFYIKSQKFDITIMNNKDYCDKLDIWEFKFTRDKSVDMINDYKYPFSVVPTIKNALEYFIKDFKPDILTFVANKDDKSRVKMYEKNAKIYASDCKYKLFQDSTTDYHAFVLFKDIEFLACVEEIISSKD